MDLNIDITNVEIVTEEDEVFNRVRENKGFIKEVCKKED